MELSRRGMLGGLLGILAAPAIIRTPRLLMPVKKLIVPEGNRLMWSVQNIQGMRARDILRRVEMYDGSAWQEMEIDRLRPGAHPFRVTYSLSS